MKDVEQLVMNGRGEPPGIPVVPLTPEQDELQRAVRNFEIYWRKGVPLNDVRLREGLPIVTKEELQRDKAKRDAPFLVRKP